MLEEDFVVELLLLLMIFFDFSKWPFDIDKEMMAALGSPWLSLGFWWDYSFDFRTIPFFLSLLFFPFLLILLLSSNGASCPFKLDFQLSDRCDLKCSHLGFLIWKQAQETSRYLSVCVVQVSSDVFKSARLMLRVGSLWSESARLSVHTFALLIESARMSSSRLERPVTF